MKTIYEKPAYGLTKKDYLEGRTLICVNQIESEDRARTSIPYDANYELRFRLCNDKYVPFFVSETEYHQLLSDDIWRITMKSALIAEKRTAAEFIKKCGPFEQDKIKTYDETVQATFGGEGK